MINLKSHPHWRYQCSFALWTALPSSNFCQWWSFPLKLCHIRKGAFYLNISSKNKTPRRTKTLISPVLNKILKVWDTLFVLIQVEVQCSQSYFKTFLPQVAGAFGNNIEKEPQKLCLKLKKYVYYIFTVNICSACSPMQVVFFCKNVLIL